MLDEKTYLCHTVEEIDRLCEILSEGFVPNYHLEDLSPSEQDKFHIALPMTSFSDVSLKEASEMHKEYGIYRIYLKKEWGVRSCGMNPVFYISDMTYLSNIIKMEKEKILDKSILRYFKKYTSRWGDDCNYCNYAEREWRHCLTPDECSWIIGAEKYNEWRGDLNNKRPRPSEKMTKNSLKFNIEDIVYIEVQTKDEKDSFMKSLLEMKRFCGDPHSFTNDELNQLERKIIIANSNNI